MDTDSEKAVETFSEVETAKKTEISNLPNSPVAERRMKAIRERQVEVVNLKRELSEQGDSIENKKMLAEMKSCEQKAVKHKKRKKSKDLKDAENFSASFKSLAKRRNSLSSRSGRRFARRMKRCRNRFSIFGANLDRVNRGEVSSTQVAIQTALMES